MSLLFKAIFEAIFGIRGRLITGVIFDAFSSTEHSALRVVIIAFSVGVAAVCDTLNQTKQWNEQAKHR
jgi:hypothetical protein